MVHRSPRTHEKVNLLLLGILMVYPPREWGDRSGHAAKALTFKMSIVDEIERKQFINSVIVNNYQDRKKALESRVTLSKNDLN